MPLENVEIVRRWFELWTERDWEAFGAIHDPDVMVIPPEGWPDGEVSRGRDAWTRQSKRLKDSWESDRNELDEVRDAGNHVLARTRWITTGKDSGIDFETQFWAVFTLADGKVARIEWFLERSRALEAAGLVKKHTRADSS
jgi:ketosteroid isomerase-like protein